MIHIQIQPERAKRLNIVAVGAALQRFAKNKRLVSRFRFEECNDSGHYLNFDYLTKQPARLWQEIRLGPFRSHLLRSASMVVCEGANGWDDYLLLHHWDRRLKLDSVDDL